MPAVPETPLPPDEALRVAQSYWDEGRAFAAHEILEAAWKAAPRRERELWRGLAQLAVGYTHLQRGNVAGGARLLRRGAANISPYTGADPWGVPVAELVAWARALATQVEAASAAGATAEVSRPPRLFPDDGQEA